ncbi:MAG: hypothetical protein AB8G22_08225 [Saprospiraceae bacterium]
MMNKEFCRGTSAQVTLDNLLTNRNAPTLISNIKTDRKYLKDTSYLNVATFLSLIIFIFCSCQPTERQVTPAFYHWQTNLNLNSTEQNALQELSANRIYAKFFDVSWNGNSAVPTAEIIINASSIPDSILVIPTIYITNETLVEIPDSKLAGLVNNIIKKINTLTAQIPNFRFTELQIDCDWTLTTREKYFQLLKLLAEELPTTNLSATIRLHQIKYKNKTGIPPVQRGVLMFYNTGNLKKWESENTILELTEAKRYIAALADYDMPLDVALPIFHWGVTYREGRLFKLINGLTATELSDTTRFTQINSIRYAVTKSTYLRGHYLYQNDKIRLENISTETLRASAELLSSRMNNDNFQLLFYHLDSTTLARHSVEELKNIQHQFVEDK